MRVPEDRLRDIGAEILVRLGEDRENAGVAADSKSTSTEGRWYPRGGALEGPMRCPRSKTMCCRSFAT